MDISGGNLESTSLNDTFLSINLKTTGTEKKVGAAFLNLDKRQMLVIEFIDNDHFSNLESLII
jgi:DNA mismatch repair protein MSH2